MELLSVKRILIDGAILSTILSTIVMAVLYINPRLFLRDYPKEIQAKVPPLSAAEKRWQLLAGVLFIGAIVGSLLFSATQLKAENGGKLPFITAFLHMYLLFVFFNLVDLLVLDYFIVIVLKPKFLVLPGTEGMEQLYQSFHNFGYHFRAFLRGLLIGAVLSLPLAIIVSL